MDWTLINIWNVFLAQTDSDKGHNSLITNMYRNGATERLYFSLDIVVFDSTQETGSKRMERNESKQIAFVRTNKYLEQN